MTTHWNEDHLMKITGQTREATTVTSKLPAGGSYWLPTFWDFNYSSGDQYGFWLCLLRSADEHRIPVPTHVHNIAVHLHSTQVRVYKYAEEIRVLLWNASNLCNRGVRVLQNTVPFFPRTHTHAIISILSAFFLPQLVMRYSRAKNNSWRRELRRLITRYVCVTFRNKWHVIFEFSRKTNGQRNSMCILCFRVGWPQMFFGHR